MRFFIVIMVLISTIHDTDQTGYTGEEKKLSLVEKHSIILKENLRFFKRVMDLEKHNKQIFVGTHQDNFLIEYDYEGNQVKILGESGRGPFEYVSPQKLFRISDTLFVWDMMLLKLIEFNTAGRPLQELTGFRRVFAFSDFIIQDGIFIRYGSGGFDKKYISIHKVLENSTDLIRELGDASDSHDKLMLYHGTAPMGLKNKIFYYGPADDTIIYSYNLVTEKLSSNRFRDGNFFVAKSKFNKRERSQRVFNQWQNFIFTNSRFKDIYTLDDYIVAEVQNGNNFDGTRETAYHIFDYSFNHIDTIRLDYEAMVELGNGAIYGSGNELIFYNGFPDKRNDEGKLIEGKKYREPENFLRKVTIFQLEEM